MKKIKQKSILLFFYSTLLLIFSSCNLFEEGVATFEEQPFLLYSDISIVVPINYNNELYTITKNDTIYHFSKILQDGSLENLSELNSFTLPERKIQNFETLTFNANSSNSEYFVVFGSPKAVLTEKIERSFTHFLILNETGALLKKFSIQNPYYDTIPMKYEKLVIRNNNSYLAFYSFTDVNGYLTRITICEIDNNGNIYKTFENDIFNSFSLDSKLREVKILQNGNILIFCDFFHFSFNFETGVFSPLDLYFQDGGNYYYANNISNVFENEDNTVFISGFFSKDILSSSSVLGVLSQNGEIFGEIVTNNIEKLFVNYSFTPTNDGVLCCGYWTQDITLQSWNGENEIISNAMSIFKINSNGEITMRQDIIIHGTFLPVSVLERSDSTFLIVGGAKILNNTKALFTLKVDFHGNPIN